MLHIFVSKSCKTLIKGLQRQIYKENTNIPDKEDGYDHMNDALGYLIDYIKPLTINSNLSAPTRWNMKQRQYGIRQRSTGISVTNWVE